MANSDWIGVDLLHSILKEDHKCEAQSIANINFTVEPRTEKGDNSDLYTVAMEYDHNGQRVNCKRILKVAPSGEQPQVEVAKKFLFPREIAVYSKIMRSINWMLNFVDGSSAISPKFICEMDHPKTMLVLEDLKVTGFQMVDRMLGLDLNHTRLVISKMAKLHACSVVAYRNNAAIIDPVIDENICVKPERQEYLTYHKLCFQHISRLVEGWNDVQYSRFLENLKNLQTKLISEGNKVYTRLNSFNVLNHGELCTSNLMFRYENESIKDVVLLDYQWAHYGSPAVDLNYFLFGSVQEDIRKNSWLELIRLYHDVLKETMKKLKKPKGIPSVQDIHMEIIRKGFHRLNAVFCQLPLSLMERTDGSEMARFLEEGPAGEAFRDDVFSNPQLEPILKRALTDFYNMGYFDVE